MNLFLYLAGLYCFADLLLFLRFKIRLKPSHFALISTSLWSSARWTILLFLLSSTLLWLLPPLSLSLILFAKWPHPFLAAIREWRTKKLGSSFPLAPPPQGDKLFDIDIRDKPHILFVFLESFRAKNVGCLGAKIPLSPHFDELAKKGILFTNFHSTGNFTNRAIVATLFGVPPAYKPWNLGRYCNLSLINLPQILSKHGYHPAVIQGSSTSFDHGAEFFEKQGFKTILGKRDLAKPGTSWGVFDEYLMPWAASWLEEQKGPIFLNLFTITNHHPWIHPEKAHGFLNTFAYTDQALGIFVDELRKRRLLEKSILFILGDHGQTLEDRDPNFEINRHLFQDNIHVPLLIYAEGRVKPAQINTVASQIDLLPTVLDLFHQQTPNHSLGKSLLRPSSSPIFFSHPLDPYIRGCREGNWKYTIRKDREELYDLSADPEEKINRISEGTSLREKTAEFFEKLDQFYSEKPEEKKESLLHLDFSNSLKMTDEKLEEIAKKNPNLSSIVLDHCMLLTDQGIASLLRESPKLEGLFLEGLDEISGLNWGEAEHLVHFKALHCPNMKLDWIAKLPSLQILQIGDCLASDADLSAIAASQTSLIAILLSRLPLITDQSLKLLLEVNQSLICLFISGCPNISKEIMSSIKSPILRYKFISS